MSLFGSRSTTSEPRQSSGFHQPKTHLFSHTDANRLMGFRNPQSVGSGLVNLGNSCFMNACLQCLAYTSPLQNYISSSHHNRNCITSSFCLFCQLHKDLPSILGKVKGSSFSPTQIFRALPKISSCLRPGRQEDAHEFLMNTLDMLQKNALKCHGRKIKDEKVKETSIVHKIFGGYLRSQVKCLHCKYESNTYDACLHLSLEISAGRSVYRALRQFTLSERLSGANQYFCERCNHKRDASKQMTIFEPPLILIVHLKRFSFMSGMHEFGSFGMYSRLGSGKINKHIAYDESLSLEPFMSYKHVGGVNFSLFAVLVHAGMSMNSGHYYSYIKAPDGKWNKMNDSLVRGCTIDDVLEQKAYLLFYARVEEKQPYRSPQTTPRPKLPESPSVDAPAVKKPLLRCTSPTTAKKKLAILKLRQRHRNYSLSSSSNSSSSSRNACAINPSSSRALSHLMKQRQRLERKPEIKPSAHSISRSSTQAISRTSPQGIKRPHVRLKKPGELLSLYRPSIPIKTSRAESASRRRRKNPESSSTVDNLKTMNTTRLPRRRKSKFDTLKLQSYRSATPKEVTRRIKYPDESREDLIARLKRLTQRKEPRLARKHK